jgi:lipid-A-disaccharide synthase-like uncharacterized protein
MLTTLFTPVLSWLSDVFVGHFDAMTALGYAAQLLFTSRFVVQWLASERAGRSIVPFAFWILSMLGGTLLLVYAVIRKDPVFILGQAGGLLIYMRNIVLVMRERRMAAL